MTRIARYMIVLAFTIGITNLARAGYSVVNGNEQTDSIQSNPVSPDKKVIFTFKPSLGLTYSNSKAEAASVSTLQWLATVNSDFDYIGKSFQVSSNLLMQYGQKHDKGMDPVTLQDAFIFTITPSLPLIKFPPIRIFLETTAETQLGNGELNDKPIGFLDPVFLYQTLFVGQKHYIFTKGGHSSYEITYGVGYSFQQTMNKQFDLIPSLTGNKADFESGFSGIAEFNMTTTIAKTMDYFLNFKAVALSRENFFNDIQACRASVLFRSGITYKWIGLEYNYHLVHDLNLSAEKQIDQSLMLSLSF